MRVNSRSYWRSRRPPASGSRSAVKSGFQLGPFGLGKQRFGCRQQFGLFGAHVVRVKADILLCLLLEGLAARFAPQFPTIPLNLETDTIPCPSRPTGERWRTHRASR